MDFNDLLVMITDGLPADQAAAVRTAIERDAVKTKVSTLKAQTEWESLQRQATELQAAIDGGPNKPGHKAYTEWYNANYPKVVEMQQRMAKYEEKYGTLEAPAQTPPNNTSVKTMTPEEVQAAVDKRIQEQYAPQWANHLTSTGTIVQKHMFAGRKVPIPFQEIAKSAVEKFQGNLEAAYDEWDRPEREKADKAATEAEIDRRVKEKVQQMGTSSTFPGSPDATPSALSQRTKASVDGFDPAALKQDLVKTFMTGEVS